MDKPKLEEAEVIINGYTLNYQESMTLRVAMNTFLSEMLDPDALGGDDTGKSISTNYAKHARNILNHIMRGCS